MENNNKKNIPEPDSDIEKILQLRVQSIGMIQIRKLWSRITWILDHTKSKESMSLPWEMSHHFTWYTMIPVKPEWSCINGPDPDHPKGTDPKFFFPQ